MNCPYKKKFLYIYKACHSRMLLAGIQTCPRLLSGKRLKFLYMNILNKRYKLLSFFLTLLLGWSSIGWIDPLADKIREGNQLYHDGNYDGALDKYVNAQIDSPEIPQLDFNIADVQYKRGKHSEAEEIFREAKKANVDLYFEAAVGGGIPIIKALRESLGANHIDTLLGIINGTSNYILSSMALEGLSFNQALAEAQKKGYAERDPSLDIKGYDSAHKLAILALLGFGRSVDLKDIYTEGIENVSLSDIEYARDFGYCVKLLAIAKNIDGKLEVRVHPTLLSVNILSDGQ